MSTPRFHNDTESKAADKAAVDKDAAVSGEQGGLPPDAGEQGGPSPTTEKQDTGQAVGDAPDGVSADDASAADAAAEEEAEDATADEATASENAVAASDQGASSLSVDGQAGEQGGSAEQDGPAIADAADELSADDAPEVGDAVADEAEDVLFSSAEGDGGVAAPDDAEEGPAEEEGATDFDAASRDAVFSEDANVDKDRDPAAAEDAASAEEPADGTDRARDLSAHLVPIEAPAATKPLPQELAGRAQESPVRRASYRPAPVDPRKDRRLGLVLGCVALAIALAFAAVTVYFSVEGQRQTEVFMLPSRTQVAVGVDAAGLDTATGSKIPLRVAGTDKDGNQVDQVAYLNADGTGLTLVPGAYQLSIAGSPIAADGTVYAVPDTVVAVEAPAVAQARLEADPFVLTPLAPEQTTAEAVDDAYTYAVRGGCPIERAPELKAAAERRAGLQ